MSRFENVLGVALVIAMAGCISPNASSSEREDLATGVTTEDLRVGAPTPRPPQTTPAAELTPAPATSIDARAAKAALKDANVRGRLHGLAIAAAAHAGVAKPGKMQVVVASDHQTAATLVSGAIVNDHAPVYVINISGGPFTAAHHPPGVDAPQGDVLTVTVDAASKRITDIGIVDTAPDLSQLDPELVDLTGP
jgi:hypothetical protein